MSHGTRALATFHSSRAPPCADGTTNSSSATVIATVASSGAASPKAGNSNGSTTQPASSRISNGINRRSLAPRGPASPIRAARMPGSSRSVGTRKTAISSTAMAGTASSTSGRPKASQVRKSTSSPSDRSTIPAEIALVGVPTIVPSPPMLAA